MAHATRRTPAAAICRQTGFLVAGTMCLSSMGIPNRIWAEPPSAKTVTFRIMGYLPDYRLKAFAPEACRHVTDLIAFSIEPEADGTLNQRRFGAAQWKRLKAISKQHGIGLHICVGGWERSKHFARMAGSPVSRRNFVENIVRLSQRHGLAGIDIDWEHPQGPRQQADYETLLTELAVACRPVGVQLSVAAAGWQSFSSQAFQAVDRIHLMSYDAPQRHATLDQSRRDIDRYLKMGCPAEKLCLCLPFYGRHIKNRTARTYAEIVETHHPRPEIDEVLGVYFNGPRTIRSKTRLALTRRLAGVCVWELGQDTQDASSLLLNIIAARKAAAGR